MNDDIKLSIRLLVVTTMFFMIGMMGTRPLVPILANELGASEFTIGLIISFFPLLPFFCAVWVGKIIAIVGCKKPLILSSLFAFISLIIPMLWTSLLGISISQLLAGIANTFYVIAAQSYIGQSSDDKIRDHNVMRFSLGVAVGSFIGPFIGGFLADWIGTSNSFFILGCVCFISTVLSYFIYEGKSLQLHADNKQDKGAIFSLFKIPNVRKAMLISSLILMGKDIFTSFFPLLGVSMGLSSSTIGFIVSINALAGILIRWCMPYLIESFGRNAVIISSIVCSGALFALLPITGQIIILGIISFLLGMGLGLGQPMSISITLLALPHEQVSQGLGLRMTVNRFIQMTAPLFFGGVAHIISLGSIFWITGAIYIVGAMKTKIKEEKGIHHSTGLTKST